MSPGAFIRALPAPPQAHPGRPDTPCAASPAYPPPSQPTENSIAGCADPPRQSNRAFASASDAKTLNSFSQLAGNFASETGSLLQRHGAHGHGRHRAGHRRNGAAWPIPLHRRRGTRGTKPRDRRRFRGGRGPEATITFNLIANTQRELRRQHYPRCRRSRPAASRRRPFHQGCRIHGASAGLARYCVNAFLPVRSGICCPPARQTDTYRTPTHRQPRRQGTGTPRLPRRRRPSSLCRARRDI
jgi:hypothetical protein